MQQPEVNFPDTYPHEYPEELLDQPDPLFLDCDYLCDQGWLPAPDGTATPCFYCNPEGRVRCKNCNSFVEDPLHCPECDSVNEVKCEPTSW